MRNRTASPLLRLPPEIRNRIYDLVLQVGQIKVCYRGGFYTRVLDRTQDPWVVSADKRTPTRGGVTLLAPACRQLYHETSLLVFSLNVWSFETPHVMERFVLRDARRPPRPARRAIRAIYARHVLTGAVDRAFGGLEVIFLYGGLRLTRAGTTDGGGEGDDDNGDGCTIARRVPVVWDVAHKWW